MNDGTKAGEFSKNLPQSELQYNTKKPHEISR
jgi:hypothetical protein